ncbi:hypothetical protein NDU88_013147 [Pleurodeles waltl]|uniref:Uncharacterized protein n=1 Tax=Pleurodeles waltl TaxID=8319 RepID=A0AAV7R282_PLEWA|nr:hypothetical protein NDU88_013147 [Pleurodeles waltl]
MVIHEQHLREVTSPHYCREVFVNCSSRDNDVLHSTSGAGSRVKRKPSQRAEPQLRMPGERSLKDAISLVEAKEQPEAWAQSVNEDRVTDHGRDLEVHMCALMFDGTYHGRDLEVHMCALMFDGRDHGRDLEVHMCAQMFDGTDHGRDLEIHMCAQMFDGTDHGRDLEVHMCALMFDGTDHGRDLEIHMCALMFDGTDHGRDLEEVIQIRDKAKGVPWRIPQAGNGGGGAQSRKRGALTAGVGSSSTGRLYGEETGRAHGPSEEQGPFPIREGQPARAGAGGRSPGAAEETGCHRLRVVPPASSLAAQRGEPRPGHQPSRHPEKKKTPLED